MKKQIILFSLLVAGFTFQARAQVGIGTSTPDNSAMLEVNSTTKGLLTPRMTASERTAINPAAQGLIVYQTDGTQGFYYYNGTQWLLLLNEGSSLNASNLTSGTVSTARLGTGTANSGTFLRGDGTWATPAASNYPFDVVTVPNTGTHNITITQASMGGYMILDFDAVPNTDMINVHMTLPSPALVGNGAKFRVSYLNAHAAGINLYAINPTGNVYAGAGSSPANTPQLVILTSDFISDGTNWYEVPQL